MFRSLAVFNFHENAVSAQNGNEYEVSMNSVITFEVTGTSTSRTLVFEGLGISGAWYPIKCCNLSTLTLATQTTGNNELWQADISGLVKFRVRISAVAGGDVTVKGKVN